MRKVAKVLLSLVVLLLVVASGALAVLFWRFPAVGPAPSLAVAGTPQQVERGRYLANHVTVCIDCHSPRDWSRFSGPPVADRLGQGGPGLSRQQGFPVSPNLTPHEINGIGGWTREAFVARFRAFAAEAPQVGPEDPNTVMPWTMYAGMTDEDLGAIYDYLRTVPPVANAVEKWPTSR